MSISTKLDTIRINKNDEINVIILNVIKMLSSRGLIDNNNVQQKYDDIIKLYNINIEGGEKIYQDNVIKIETNRVDTIFLIKILRYKITTINKQDSLINFLETNADNKIIIVDDINKKAYKQLIEYPKTEIFWHYELMINLIDHKYIPEHTILPDKYLPNKNDDEYKGHPKFEDIYLAKKKDCPKLEITDPVARYYNLSAGQIVRIKRKSANAGYSISYRVVVNVPLSKLFD